MGTLAKVFVSLILVSCWGCEKAKKTGSSADSVKLDSPVLVIAPIHVRYFGLAGSVDWELVAPEARSLAKGNILKARDLTISLFESGQKSTTIKADEGFINTGGDPWDEGSRYRLSGGDMFLNGNVVVLSTEPARLETDWLTYQKGLGVIFSTAPVNLVRGRSTTKGTGLEATPDLKSVKIFNQTLVIESEEEGH